MFAQVIDLSYVGTKTYISIHKATLHNLKQLSVEVPRSALTVITGVSGSGKSSLIFDTLFAEGQRRYVESLSTYARQFLSRVQKPPVEWIRGISPAVAIQQRTRTHNPRSTVGTMTEIYDYLRLLYARVGKTYSPISGTEVQRDSASDVLSYLEALPEGTKYHIAAPFLQKDGASLLEQLRITLQKGYTRLLVEEDLIFIEDLSDKDPAALSGKSLALFIDRDIVAKKLSKAQRDRMLTSIQTAFMEGKGYCFVQHGKKRRTFSEHFESDGMRFVLPSLHMFSFNSPQGACPKCGGFGSIMDVDPNKVVPDPTLSVYEGALAPLRSPGMKAWLDPLLTGNVAPDFPIHRPYRDLSDEEQQWIWKGEDTFKGLHRFFAYLKSKKHKIRYRVLLSRYQGKVCCPACKGSRLRKEASYVRIGNHSIGALLEQPLTELAGFFDNLLLSEAEQHIAAFLLSEIKERIGYLLRVGLGYLTLSRLASTLSGGEYQRIQLATALGRPLVGAMYILDEPTIGLHPRDVDNLVSVLQDLRDKGNPVLVVEHEERVMRAADHLLDIGPGAGIHGGQLVFQGSFKDLSKATSSYTAQYLTKKRCIDLPTQRRSDRGQFRLKGLRMHNLKNISVDIPLGVLTVLTGVSGSGKSTLVQEALCPALAYELGLSGGVPPRGYRLLGEYRRIRGLQFVDQRPIGRSSRSNPATYLKIYDLIRQIFAQRPQARHKGFTAAHFSFNVPAGRCEACAGEGEITIEMQFMADVRLPCEACKGRRFKDEVLEVTYKGKCIDEVLEMSAEEALSFFSEHRLLCQRLQALIDVGLDYIHLGQSSSSLSGGEAQRVKLAVFLLKKIDQEHQHTLFIFDEPTTGLHIHDINRLLRAVQALVDMGHSVFIVEHNLDVIKCADWIIDLGPEAGDQGGKICFAGTPEQLCQQKNNYTAHYLREKMT